MNVKLTRICFGFVLLMVIIISGCAVHNSSAIQKSGTVKQERLVKTDSKQRPIRTIGIIGGVSWASSIEYYRLMNEMVRDTLGGVHSAQILMYSIEEEVGIPVIHIADATGEKVRDKGVRTAALLGTKYTMEQPFYRSVSRNTGSRLLHPTKKSGTT